jgi:hypothetical protein
MYQSIFLLEADSGEFDVLGGIDVHVELDLPLKFVEVFLALPDTDHDDDGGDDN